MEKKTIKGIEDIKIPNYLEEQEKIKSGLFPLDQTLGGGFSRGKLVQLVGNTKSGKTTLALQVALGFCFQGKTVVYIDAKGDITNQTLQNIGLSSYLETKSFIYIRECVFSVVEQILDEFISTGKVDLIIIDTLPSLINGGYLQIDNKSKKIKSDNNNTNYGTRPLSLLTSKLKKLAMTKNFCLLFINEFRNKVDMRIGTIDKVFGPKSLESETNYIIQVRPIKGKTNAKFKERFAEIEAEYLGKPSELVVIKGAEAKPMCFPFVFEYEYGYKAKYMIINALIEKKLIIKHGEEYSLVETSLKVVGLKKFIDMLESSNILKEYLNFTKEYYNQKTFNQDIE